MLSEIVYLSTSPTTNDPVIADGTSTTGWKRKTGITPKDYLFPLFVMADSDYCTE